MGGIELPQSIRNGVYLGIVSPHKAYEVGQRYGRAVSLLFGIAAGVIVPISILLGIIYASVDSVFETI